MRRKVGSDVATPGVSAQPGCMAWNTTSLAGTVSAHISLSVTWARLARAYCSAPR